MIYYICPMSVMLVHFCLLPHKPIKREKSCDYFNTCNVKKKNNTGKTQHLFRLKNSWQTANSYCPSLGSSLQRWRLTCRRFIRNCSWCQYLWKEKEESRNTQKEKLGCSVASVKASANPKESSEKRLVLWNRPDLEWIGGPYLRSARSGLPRK